MTAFSPSRRRAHRAAAALTLTTLGSIAALAASTAASAQSADWPTQPVKVIVGFPAGSSPDLVARTVAEPLAQALGQPVIIDNKPGAGGNIGTDAVAKATDNQTFGFTINGPLTTAPKLYKKLPYDVDKDLRLLSLAAISAQVLVVDADLPVQTLPELVEYAKTHKPSLAYGSVGVGSGSHLTAELFAAQTGIELLHVPYQSFPQVTNAILGHQIQVAFMAPSGALAQAKAGKLKMLAVTSTQTSPTVPGVPTVAAAAQLPNFKAELWVGAIAPKSMPQPIADRLSAEIEKILHAPEVREKLALQGWQAVGSTPQQMVQRVDSDTALWGDVIKRADVTLD